MSANKKPRLGDYLIEKGLITHDQLNAALLEQQVTGEFLGTILVFNGFISQSDLIEAIKSLDVTKLAEESTHITRSPLNLLKSTRTMILAESAKSVYLATLSQPRIVEALLKRYYPAGTQFFFQPAEIEKLQYYLTEIERFSGGMQDPVDTIIRQALMTQTTDIHIEPRRKSFSIFFRRLGVRELAMEKSLDDYQIIATKIKEKANIDIAETRIPQDGKFQIEHHGQIVDMRVATIPVVQGEKIVIRVLDPTNTVDNLDQLGITAIENWRKGISHSHGLCLICGPTGSGKTTTLNASVREMDRFGMSINTMEDPVEYAIPYVSQMTVNPLVGLDFPRGAKAFLRMDPDIMVLGELRDEETARVAIKAAETGHLVIATLHTGSIAGSIERLADLGIQGKTLTGILRTVLVQRLVRTVCEYCEGEGCVYCNHSGYGGRTVVSECAYFGNEKDVENVIEGQRPWTPMIQDALSKMKQGITNEKEIDRIFGEEAVSQ